MLFVSLVQGVATTFGMRFNRQTRDWHTDATREALPQTKPDIHIEEEHLLPQSRAALSGHLYRSTRRDKQALPP